MSTTIDRDKIRMDCHKAVSSNDKFRGEKLFVPYYAELAAVSDDKVQHFQLSWFENDGTHCWRFVVTSIDRELFPELNGVNEVILKYDPDIEVYTSDNNA